MNKPKQLSKLKQFINLTGWSEGKPPIILSIHEVCQNNPNLTLGNGGSWFRVGNCGKYKIATLKGNGEIRYQWVDPDPTDKRIVCNAFKNVTVNSITNSINYIGIFGTMIPSSDTRPIRKDIGDHYRSRKCVVCGTSTDVQCDHKNDMYNDARVLSTKTQTFSDFQSLCRRCNLLKRQCNVVTRKTRLRYKASSIPMLEWMNIDFTSGTEEYSPIDPNCMIGTYWYDPVQFVKDAFKLTKETVNQENIELKTLKNNIDALEQANELLLKELTALKACQPTIIN